MFLINRLVKNLVEKRLPIRYRLAVWMFFFIIVYIELGFLRARVCVCVRIQLK